MLWGITYGRRLLCAARNRLPETRLHMLLSGDDVSRTTTRDSHTPCLWIWYLIWGPGRSSLPPRSTALTPRLVGENLTHSCRVRAGVGQGPTLSLSTSLDRSSRSTAAVGTAESLASISGAGLAATEGWRLPAGTGAGALQCLAMWPGCWQRWQRRFPLLRLLLGHLPSLCSLSSRRSIRSDNLYSSRMNVVKKADESASAAAEVGTEYTSVEHAARLHSPLMSRQCMDPVILDS